MTTPTNGRTRGSRSTMRNLIVLGLIILAGVAMEQLFRAADAPWSFGAAGITPEGDWVAPVTLADGTAGFMYMTLEFVNSEEDTFSGDNLSGSGRYCLGEHEETLQCQDMALSQQ